MKQEGYWKYIKPYLSAFIIGPILMLVEVVGEVVMPKLFAVMNNTVVSYNANRLSAADANATIVGNGLLMAGMAVLMFIGGTGGAYFSVRASSKFACDLRKDVFNHIQNFSFENIDKFSTGSLVTRTTNDITQLQNFVSMILRMALRAPGMMIGGIIMALMTNAKLALIVLCMVPILAIAIALMLWFSFPLFQKMQTKLDNLNTKIQENLTNVRVVKSFVREDYETDKFKESNKDLKDSTMAAMKIMIATMPVMTLAMNVTTLAIVWFGGKRVVSGDMTVGDLTAFITYITQILSSLMMLSMIIMNASRAMASSKRIRAVLNEEVTLTDENGSEDLKVEHGSVEFKDVCFRYYKNTDAWVLDHISFSAKPGETVGIIGSTGCGKTTLVSMIPRLYDPDEGEILVDGKNVKDYKFTNLRDGVGMVLQKNVLFSGSIEENLRWGNEDATDEEIRQVAKVAQADKFIDSFDDGYGMELGQGGVNVSGGQKQRLCIARALLKNPKIIILDDSTSAVDTATEANIRYYFANDLKDTTKLIIAQRIGSVMEADKIIVLDEGRIVGEGKHEELLKTCVAYREIYASQMENRKEA
ncbi:MAG: ABC transporter ATP-binding protein/permease [Lachnospiraceae bacterium]|nr:ABC transporter ATP-binding protein/permease [Lachnospiraceae bacterium]